MKLFNHTLFRIFAAILLFWLSSAISLAQTADCNEQLKQGEELFKIGVLDSIPLIIEPCIGKYDQARRIDAYKLLILTYIYLNRYSLADIYMEQMLRFDPEVLVENVGSQEFIQMYKSYRTKPLFGIGIHLNFNVAQPILTINSEDNFLAANHTTTPFIGAGFAVGPSFQFYPFRKAYFDVHALFQTQRFGFNQSLLNFADVNFTENQILTRLQPSVIFEFTNRNLKPYLKAGAGLSYLIRSTATVERTYSNTSDFNQRSITATDVIVSNLRQRVQLSLLAGFGGVYSIRRGKIYFELELQNLMHNAIVSDRRFSHDNLIYNYFYTDNNFLLSNINVNIRYIRTFYKPKKIGK
ncbi:MAG TPA: hypothetical protein DCQ31_17200 [Bacteroidales bacterium]|nr:hypothetical protein [Bacteroidales bacterium]